MTKINPSALHRASHDNRDGVAARGHPAGSLVGDLNQRSDNTADDV
jgi:hypothetical protein